MLLTGSGRVLGSRRPHSSSPALCPRLEGGDTEPRSQPHPPSALPEQVHEARQATSHPGSPSFSRDTSGLWSSAAPLWWLQGVLEPKGRQPGGHSQLRLRPGQGSWRKVALGLLPSLSLFTLPAPSPPCPLPGTPRATASRDVTSMKMPVLGQPWGPRQHSKEQELGPEEVPGDAPVDVDSAHLEFADTAPDRSPQQLLKPHPARAAVSSGEEGALKGASQGHAHGLGERPGLRAGQPPGSRSSPAAPRTPEIQAVNPGQAARGTETPSSSTGRP